MFLSQEFRKEIREFMKQFDVKVHYVKKGWSYADMQREIIALDLRECDCEEKAWSLAFHELAHIVCYREGIYKKYHDDVLPPKKYAKYIRRYGLRAERHVDKMGEQFMAYYFPKMKYMQAYRDERDIKWYYKWVNRMFPL